MKNFTQKFIGIFALVFAMSFTANAQSPCQGTADAYLEIINDVQAIADGYWTDLQDCNSEKTVLQMELNAANQQITSLQNQLNNSFTQTQAHIDAVVDSLSSIMDALVSEVNASSTDDYIILASGWSMFGYSCLDSIDAVEAFASIADKIEVVKDEWGLSYLPSWGFNAMGSLHYSEGYQIKMTEDVNDFQFCKKTAPIEIGCSDPNAFNYSPNASITLNSVCVDKVFGCLDDSFLEYDPNANTNDESQCLTLKVFGCSNLFGTNYNPEANIDDGSCIFPIYGCMDENAGNFNPNASVDALVESNTYFTDHIWGEDSNGNIIYYTDTLNDGDLNIVVNSGGYKLWGIGYDIQENSSVTISLNGGLPFNIEDFGQNQINNDNSAYQYQDCMMLGVEQYNEYYGEFEGLVSSCEDLFVFKPMATVSGSNGYSIDISNENYGNCGYCSEFWENLGQNLSGSVSITIETEEDIRFKLKNMSIQSVDESSSSCLDCVELACGCGMPAIMDYDCDGNLLTLQTLQIGDLYQGGYVFQINEDGTGLVASLEDIEVLPWNDAMLAASNSTAEGFEDWRLPTLEELELMYNTIGQGADNVGGFSTVDYGNYWSSQIHPDIVEEGMEIISVFRFTTGWSNFYGDAATFVHTRIIREF